MNIIIYKKDSNKIIYFVKDCVKKGNNFFGTNKRLHGIKNIEYKWTRDIVNPILDEEGNRIGWDKSVNQINEEAENREIKEVTDIEFREAIKLRKVLMDLTYNEIDNHIETNITNLSSAKQYLKKLSKVILAISRIIDKNYKI